MTGDARGTAFFLFLVYAVAQCYNSVEESTKIDHTELLAALLADHDIRIRPNVHGEPVVVFCGLYLRSFDSISEASMDYSITTYFRQHWNDPRLQFNATGFINMNGNIMDAIWVPDLYFENAKDTAVHTTTKDNLFLRIYPNGDVFYSVRLGLKLTCHMHLSRFPMDRQQCKIEVETYSYTTTDMKLQWFDTSPLQIDPEVILPQYEIVSYNLREITREYTTGNYSHLIAKIKLKRELGFYILQAYVPSILLVILSWFSLWMEPSAAPARVALGITTVLALVTQGTWMRSQLPKVAYATAIDIWMVTCQVFVFGALLEFAMVYYLASLQKTRNTQYKKRRQPRGNQGNGTVRYPQDKESTKWIVRSSSFSDISTQCADDAHYVTAPSLLQRRTGSATKQSSHDTKSAENEIPRRYKLRNYQRIGACVDRYSRVIFPILFLIFNAVYWYKFLFLPDNLV